MRSACSRAWREQAAGMSPTETAPVAFVPGAEFASPASASASRKALFLDRDGVINVDLGYVHSAEQTQWVPGIFELCHAARDAGFLLVVVTNQAGIARGHYDDAQFRQHTQWVHAQFEARGVPVAATYYCPHHPTKGLGPALRDCECRKPKPGMILAAAEALALDVAECVLVGDNRKDILAAAAAGVGRAFLFGAGDVPEPFPAGQTGVQTLRQIPALLGWIQEPSAASDY